MNPEAPYRYQRRGALHAQRQQELILAAIMCLLMGREMRHQMRIQRQGNDQQVTLFLIATLAYSVQVKYQSSEVSPFEIHKITIPTLMVDLVIYGIAWANEVNLQAPNDAIYYTVACKIHLLASTLAVVLLVLILVPILGWLLLGLWFILFLRVSSTSYQETYRLLLEAYDELKRLSGNAFNELKRVIGISFDGLKRLIGNAFLRLKRVCIEALDKFKRPIEEVGQNRMPV